MTTIAKGVQLQAYTKMNSVVSTIVGYLLAVGFGWVSASFMKVGKKEFEKWAEAWTTRLVNLEKDVPGRMTRTEFEQAFGKVETLVRDFAVRQEALVRDFRQEAKQEFRDLKAELKTKT